jgi:class 3 adenylate cyclase
MWDRDLDEWLPIAEERVRLARGIDSNSLFKALAWRATTRLRCGDVAGMQADHEEMEPLAVELRTPLASYAPALRRALQATLLGDLDAAQELAIKAFEAGRRAFRETAQQNLLAQMCVILLHRGVLRSNRTIEKIAGQYPDPVYRSLLARCYAAENAREMARREFEILAEDNFSKLSFGLNWSTSMCLLAETCSYLEDRERARTLYDKMSPYPNHFAVGGESGSGQFGPFGLRLGMLARLLGLYEEAELHFRSCIDWLEEVRILSWLAHGRIEYARLLLARSESGDPGAIRYREGALDQANRGLALGRQLGMKGVVEEAISLKLALQGSAEGTLATSIEMVAARVREERPDLAPCSAPDGSVTLIFSDIEDYTGMLEQLGDLRAHLVVQDYNRIVHKITAAHGGHEVELRGDGILLAFARPEQALRSAVALQRAFAQYSSTHRDAPIHLRIGVHTGEAIQNADTFFGRSVVHAFRISDLARGRQILVSADTKERVEGSMALHFEDEREVDLKGLEGRHRVYSVRWEAATP